MDKRYYVYRWFNVVSNYTFYVGKGCGNRYKSKLHRNKLFLSYCSENVCDVEILAYFTDEFDALKKEKELIAYYRLINECSCNVSDGGYGGLSFVWTDAMRKYKSKYNPMKDIYQRYRMRKNNPMKDPNIAKLVATKLSKHPIINGVRYETTKQASESLDVCLATIQRWCHKGYNTNYEICYYENEAIPKFTKKVTCSRAILVGDK